MVALNQEGGLIIIININKKEKNKQITNIRPQGVSKEAPILLVLSWSGIDIIESLGTATII